MQPALVKTILSAIKTNINNYSYDEKSVTEKIQKQIKNAIYKPLSLTFHMQNYLAEKQNKSELEVLLARYFGTDWKEKVELIYDKKEGKWKVEETQEKSGEKKEQDKKSQGKKEKEWDMNKLNPFSERIGEIQEINGKLYFTVYNEDENGEMRWCIYNEDMKCRRDLDNKAPFRDEPHLIDLNGKFLYYMEETSTIYDKDGVYREYSATSGIHPYVVNKKLFVKC